MNTLTKIENSQNTVMNFDQEQIEIIKNTICKGASDSELKFFIYACKKYGLDPLAKQIYSIPRGNVRTIQTSIDGLRLIADRTGKYSPSKEPTFTYDQNGKLFSSTAYLMKQTQDGRWHEISAVAFFQEFNSGQGLWYKMPHIMLSKCAEAQALRKSFPAELSGLYASEEMEQAEKIDNQINNQNLNDMKKNDYDKKIECKGLDDVEQFKERHNIKQGEKIYDYVINLSQKYKMSLDQTLTSCFLQEEKFINKFNELNQIVS